MWFGLLLVLDGFDCVVVCVVGLGGVVVGF